MKRPKRLTAAFVRTITVPGRYGDGFGGFGLSLLVKPRVYGGVARSWSQRLRIDGKPRNVGLGGFPLVTLAEARQRALDNARMVEHGTGDPRRPRRTVPTFVQAVEKVIELHRAGWKGSARTERNWRASLRDHAAALADVAVDRISTADVLRVLSPIWHEKPETADRVRTRISAVMKWAVAEGHRTDDPAGDAIREALPKRNGGTRHHRAVPHAEVGAALATVRESGAWWGSRLAVLFATLTAVRSGEATAAQWSEIDMDAATWTVPASRSKTKREHRVALSRQAVRVLHEARELARGGVDPAGVVFPPVG